MRERQQLAEDGVVTVAAAVDWSGKLMAQPAIHYRGVVTSVELSLLDRLIARTVEKILSDRWSEFSQNVEDEVEVEVGADADLANQNPVDLTAIRIEIESSLQRLIKRELQSSPLVVFLLQTSEQPVVRSARRRKRSTASVAS
jgi:ribonuclease J